MSDMIDIEWNNFLKICCDNYPEESCAFLYAKIPFHITEKWFVFPVDNVAEDKKEGWLPDKKQMAKIKRKARFLGLTKIGNIHSHPLPENFKDFDTSSREKIIDYHKQPSDVDLKYAKKYNNIVRGILVIDSKRIYAYCFHDQFGEPLSHIYLNGVNHRDVEIDIQI